MTVIDTLDFKQISTYDLVEIKQVYNILKDCGKDMHINQNLVHWLTPYPIESISKDCNDKFVFLVKKDFEAIATFTLSKDEEGVLLSKFAVSPKMAHQGIGKLCLKYIEDWCRKQAFDAPKKIHLDVYDKSLFAVRFYEKNGFKTTGKRPTRNFEVLLMEKNVE